MLPLRMSLRQCCKCNKRSGGAAVCCTRAPKFLTRVFSRPGGGRVQMNSFVPVWRSLCLIKQNNFLKAYLKWRSGIILKNKCRTSKCLQQKVVERRCGKLRLQCSTALSPLGSADRERSISVACCRNAAEVSRVWWRNRSDWRQRLAASNAASPSSLQHSSHQPNLMFRIYSALLV